MIRDPALLAAFVLANTEIAAPSLVPEIRLHLATAMVPIWQASEAALEEMGIEPPYWAFCWPGSQALARLLLDGPERVAGRTVLDFASGCGLAAIAAALAGADASANDVDPTALAAIALNAELSRVDVRLEGGDLTDQRESRWDVVVAGDVCYERRMSERVIGWLRGLAAGGTEVLLADPGRSYRPRDGMTALTSYVVPTSLDLEDRESRECVVWRLLP